MQPYFENKKRGTENFRFSYYKESYSNHSIKLHWHPEIELIYGIDGELSVNLTEKKYILRKGDILFINPKELHSYAPISSRVQYHVAVFDISLFRFQGTHFFEERFTEPLSQGTLQFPRLLTDKHPAYPMIVPIVDTLFNQHITSQPLIFADLVTLFSTCLELSLLQEPQDLTNYKKSEDIKTCICHQGRR